MNFSNFLLISFLLLAPNSINFFGDGGVLGVDAISYENTKKSDNEKPYGYTPKPYYQASYDEAQNLEQKNPSPVKISYEPSPEVKCLNGRKIKVKEDDLSREEIETVKDVDVKWQINLANKNKNQVGAVCKPAEKVVKIDFPKEEFKRTKSLKKGSIMCADCEQCELQIKAHGDGVYVKCKGCRPVPADEVIFPIGNNQKVIKFP